MKFTEIPRGVGFPRPPSGTRVRASPPPGGPYGMYCFPNGFQQNPMGPYVLPTERRGQRSTLVRGAVEAGKVMGRVKAFTLPITFRSVYLWFLLSPGGAAGERSFHGESSRSCPAAR